MCRKGLLARVETDISELTKILTQQRIREDSVMGSYRSVVTPGEYDWLGHALKPNHLDYAGFACPGSGEAIYRSKRPLPIGQGQRASGLCEVTLETTSGVLRS